MRLSGAGLFIFLLFLHACSSFAQSPNGTISGIVLDPSGRAIAGADVVVVNDGTGVQYLGKTNDEGIYVVPNLPPGPYRLQVAKIGFKTLIKPDIVLNVQDALAINFTMPLGAVSETVTVEGGAPLVKTESGSVGTVIDRQQVENLPLNGRSFNTLLQLVPGVVIVPASYYSPGQFSIAGQRSDANYFSVDGVAANFGVTPNNGVGTSGTGTAQAFSAVGGTSSLVSVEALQEFRIETSSYAPEFGRSPGGQVLLTTRSGTNDFHGGAYDYFRNDVMDANSWFANAAGKARPPERHNDFGVFLGGPLRKDKTFFYFSYEGARLSQPTAGILVVPSDLARTNASTALSPFVGAYPKPDPNAPVSPDGYTAQFTAVYSNRASLNATSLRIDHTFNDRFSLFGRYNYAPSSTLTRSGSTVSPVTVNTQTLTLGLNMSLPNSIWNTVRGNYSTQESRNSFSLDSFGGAVPPDPSLFLGSLSSTDNLAAFAPYDASELEVGRNGLNRTKQANLIDELSIVVGSHQLRFGADYRALFLDVTPYQHEVFYTPMSVKSFLTSGTSQMTAYTRLPARILTQSFSAYAQDSWKIMQRLTLTYGLRWEIDPAPKALGSTRLASWTNIENPARISLAPAGTALWGTTYGNLAPRVGAAYRLTKQGDFVLRAGWGIFYDLGVGASGQLLTDFPNLAFGGGNVSMPVGNISAFLPVPSMVPPYPYVEGFSPDLKLPRSYQWNVALEKSFAGNQVVSVTYVGQSGRELLRQEVLSQPNADFSQDVALTINNARSNYNALQLQYRKPVTSRLQALLSYTFSHSLDNASDDVTAGLSNTVISAANDYASSSFDVRHILSGAFLYTSPSVGKSRTLKFLSKDWCLDSVIVVRTGLPFNALNLFTSLDANGVVALRPDVVPGQPYWVSNGDVPGGKMLNENAFAVPPTVRQGTEGRNDIRGFGLTQIDLSLGRTFPLIDRMNLQFRADAFNVFNHPNFANPSGFVGFGPLYLQSRQTLNQGLGGLSPLFQEGGPRSLQVSLKLSF